MSEEIENKPRRFSYSAHNMYLTCQRKYWHNYINKTPKDVDVVEDATALRVGKCLHFICETCWHDEKNFKLELFEQACDSHEIEKEDRYKVYACAMACFKIHAASKLKAAGMEIEVGDEWTTGFVDLVLECPISHEWRICDLKSSGMVVHSLFSRLAKDPQLNLYSFFADQIAEKLKLDLNKFKGIHYRVAVKPRSAPKSNESYAQYTARINPEVYDVFIPKEELNPLEAYDKMIRIRQAASKLTEETAECNRQACINYNFPCSWWSRCHKDTTFTDCGSKCIVRTCKDMMDLTSPKDELEGLL